MGPLRYNIALIVANILFGVSFSVYVSLLHGVVQPSQLFVLQLLFWTVVFAPIATVQRNFFRLSFEDFGSIFIVALLVVFGWWYLLIEGASHTNPIDASTISTIGPIFTLITSIITHSRPATRGEKMGIFVALTGVIVIIADRGRMLVGNGAEGYGNALILCAVIAMAINPVLITPVLRRYGTVVVMGWYYLIGVLLAMPLVVQELSTIHLSDFSRGEMAEIGYIFIFGSVLPTYLLYVGSENLTATHTAVYRYIQPIIATIVATARGQAIIDRTNIVGAVLIFIGMLCVIIFTPRPPRGTSLTRG